MVMYLELRVVSPPLASHTIKLEALDTGIPAIDDSSHVQFWAMFPETPNAANWAPASALKMFFFSAIMAPVIDCEDRTH